MRVALVNPPEVAGYLSLRDKADGLGTMQPQVRGESASAPASYEGQAS